MKRAFTLIELLVVIAIISVLMALGLPVARLAREHAAEAVCGSNLHEMALILKVYCNDHDSLFPNPTYIYHSRESFRSHKPGEPFRPPYGGQYPWTCRWHDARIGAESPLMRERREFQGDLMPYVGNAKVLLCKTGVRAYLERGCHQDSNEPRRPQPSLGGGGGGHPGRGRRRMGRLDGPNEPLSIIPQYAYTMNGNLHRTFLTGGFASGSPAK